MRIAVRVDASRSIGTGHLRRSLSLAYALRAYGSKLLFITRDLGVDSAAMVEAAGFPCLRLPAPPVGFEPDPAIPHAAWAGIGQVEDAGQSVAALRNSMAAPDWVLVDSYAFGADWHRTMRASLGCRIAAIDDVADRYFDVDLLIDHNHAADHRAKYAGSLGEGAGLLGGPSFSLLGPAFADAPRYAFRHAVGSIGIFLGGVDVRNVSLVALTAVDLAGFDGHVEIVTTSANPHVAELHAAAAKRPRTVVSVDLDNLADFFARHDLQIGAGGGATWERCCIGVPTLLLVVADNQLSVVPDLAAGGVIATVEPIDSLDPTAIAPALQALLQDPDRRAMMARAARMLVDGRGAARIARAMEQMHEDQHSLH